MNRPTVTQLSIEATPISADAYAAFGDVISARPDLPWIAANMGTARRWNRLCDLENGRPGKADLNVCFYKCEPASARPLVLELLERHRFSTQVFVPMDGTRRYLVVVAPPGDAPEIDKVRAFVVGGGQAISYRPGVWHHPMIALDAVSDFTCLVWETGERDDCEVVSLPARISVRLDG